MQNVNAAWHVLCSDFDSSRAGKYERDMKLIEGTAMIEAGGSI